MTFCKKCQKNIPGSRMSFAMHCMSSKIHRSSGKEDPRWKRNQKVASQHGVFSANDCARHYRIGYNRGIQHEKNVNEKKSVFAKIDDFCTKERTRPDRKLDWPVAFSFISYVLGWSGQLAQDVQRTHDHDIDDLKNHLQQAKNIIEKVLSSKDYLPTGE